jgi:8-oxo-dGTP diphosphatase
VARGSGQPRSGDDARNLAVFPPENLPETLAFDHAQILADYLKVRRKWLEKT